MHVRAWWNIPQVGRRTVVPNHPVGEHRKIVSLRVVALPQTATTIDWVRDDKITSVLDSGPCGWKDPRLWNVIPQRSSRFVSGRDKACQEKDGYEENAGGVGNLPSGTAFG